MGYRLYVAPGVRAALTFYSDWPHAFDELAIACGSIFAAYCSPMVFTEDVLGIAVGILLATDKIDVATAFDRLHRAGRRLRRTLPDVARRVVDDRRLPEESPSAEGWRDAGCPSTISRRAVPDHEARGCGGRRCTPRRPRRA